MLNTEYFTLRDCSGFLQIGSHFCNQANWLFYFFCYISSGNEYVVISNRPLKDSELFEVRITDMIDKWTGSIEVGVTVLQPDKMEIPATITSIQSNTWVMSGCNIASGGKTLKDNYGISLDTLKVCAMSVCVVW